jgi:hypothetical protein
MQLNIQDKYEAQVIEIWDKYVMLLGIIQEGFEYRNSPILPLTVKKEALLFIGINPSYSKSNNQLLENRVAFYPQPWDNQTDNPYFKRFKEIAAYCDCCEWSHLDLLFIRETDQNVIKGLMYDKQGIDFINAQLKISFEIINSVCPKVIVVSNALAAEFFGKMKKEHKNAAFEKIWMGYNLDFDTDFDNNLGSYKISINGKETPIIFSGMLSGQRALDIGSFERLKWQIKRILEMNK